jgi:hypothetical protein
LLSPSFKLTRSHPHELKLLLKINSTVAITNFRMETIRIQYKINHTNKKGIIHCSLSKIYTAPCVTDSLTHTNSNPLLDVLGRCGNLKFLLYNSFNQVLE